MAILRGKERKKKEIDRRIGIWMTMKMKVEVGTWQTKIS